ncbi:MAG TPA: response regulator [Bacilli bacterium]
MKIMIVDDEPFFLRKLRKVIEEYRDIRQAQIEIAAECYSGQMALQEIPGVLPDVVFTDIQMSSVDGIELSNCILKRWPMISVVIISAFPSFEYAREAMRAQVADFLLKPIEKPSVYKILDKLQEAFANKQYVRSQEILQKWIENRTTEDLPVLIAGKAFAYPKFSINAISKLNSYYDRKQWLPQNTKIYHDFRKEGLSHLDPSDELWIIHPENSREIFMIIGYHQDSPEMLTHIRSEAQLFFAKKGVSPSIAYTDGLQDLNLIYTITEKLTQLLYKHCVIGRAVLLSLSAYSNQKNHLQFIITVADERQMNGYLTKKNWNAMKEYIQRLFLLWETNSCPYVYLERNLKHIVQLFIKQDPGLDLSLIKKLENQMEEIVYVASTFHEAAESFCDLIAHTFELKATKVSHDYYGQELFKQIELYLASHLGNPVTLTELMEQFHVSSTYICNLFREFSGKTFVEYFTNLRISKSAELLKDYPDMLLKDIAEIVGYTDQNYFSRVFKIVMEKSPTDYRNKHVYS